MATFLQNRQFSYSIFLEAKYSILDVFNPPYSIEHMILRLTQAHFQKQDLVGIELVMYTYSLNRTGIRQ